MKLKRKSDEKLYDLIWPGTLPTKEQLQENDMTGVFITIQEVGLPLDQNSVEHTIYAPFSRSFEFDIINEEGDKEWTM